LEDEGNIARFVLILKALRIILTTGRSLRESGNCPSPIYSPMDSLMHEPRYLRDLRTPRAEGKFYEKEREMRTTE
jgi:hypothetical protein